MKRLTMSHAPVPLFAYTRPDKISEAYIKLHNSWLELITIFITHEYAVEADIDRGFSLSAPSVV